MHSSYFRITPIFSFSRVQSWLGLNVVVVVLTCNRNLENGAYDLRVGAVDGLDEQRLPMLIDRVESGTGRQQHSHDIRVAGPGGRVHRPIEVFLLDVGLFEQMQQPVRVSCADRLHQPASASTHNADSVDLPTLRITYTQRCGCKVMNDR